MHSPYLFSFLFIHSTNNPVDLDYATEDALLEWMLYGDDIGCWTYLESHKFIKR